MYLPKNLQISSPYVSHWYGESGRQYDFVVVRATSFRINEPAVYVLAKHEGNMIVPLSVGQTESSFNEANGSTSREWEEALAQGMTHAHLRFEARSESFRQAEVQDLVVALRPMLNELPMRDSDFIRLSPDRLVEEAAPPEPESQLGTARVPVPREPPAKRPRDSLGFDLATVREWPFWSMARAAIPSVPGLFGRVVRQVGLAKNGSPANKAARQAADDAKDPETPVRGGSVVGTVDAVVETVKRAGGENGSLTGDDRAMDATERRHAGPKERPAEEPPAREPPAREPAVEEPAVEEPPVEEPPVSEPVDTIGGFVQSVAQAKAALGLDPAVPVALFADEMSAAAGADILVDALMTVCHDDRPLNFLIVGEGPLRGELEARVHQAGLAERSRFLGDASAERFAKFFTAADFVIIPARVRRNEVLVCRAAAAGKPVLVTHQAWVDVIVHGRNGLVTYDNPGSFVWGLRELVHCMQFTSSADDPLGQSVAA